MAVDLRVVVAVLPELFDQPEEPVVVPVGWALCVRNRAGVQAGVRAWLGHRDALESAVPARGVVRAFPRVIGGDKPGCLGITLGGEVAVPVDHPRVQRLHARADLRSLLPRRQLPDPLQRQGVHRRLADPSRLHRGRGRRRRHGGVPPLRPGKVGVILARAEHEVRHHARRPLRGEQALELGHGPPDVQVRPADRDERAVPAPLVRVQDRRRPRPTARVVGVQHGGCPVAQRRAGAARSRSWRVSPSRRERGSPASTLIACASLGPA